MVREVDLCVVGVCSLAFGGPHHSTLAVGSSEATTHLVQLPDALLTTSEPHEARSLFEFYCSFHLQSPGCVHKQ